MSVKNGGFGALNVDEEREFDIVEFISDPYYYERGNDMDTGQIFEPEDGEQVVDVQYWEKLASSARWFIPKEEKGTVRIKHLLDSNIEVFSISKDNMLPRGYPQGLPPLQNSKKNITQQTQAQLTTSDRANLSLKQLFHKSVQKLKKGRY